ncbi:hypothetical protein AN189_01280 [Loktanella sp. 3ANDIMAR09]|nr:hypothetical protein AN189_01280 [Loktanella sp. 3ANDIMAR09]
MSRPTAPSRASNPSTASRPSRPSRSEALLRGPEARDPQRRAQAIQSVRAEMQRDGLTTVSDANLTSVLAAFK